MADEDITIEITDSEDIELNLVEDTPIEINIEGNAPSPTHFIDLTDVPNSYTGKTGNILRVNSGEDGLEFTSNDVDWGEIEGTLSDQTDLQDALDLKYDSADFNTDFDTAFGNKTTDDLDEGSTNLYDKNVSLTAGDGISITGTYPDFTVTNVSEGNTDHAELDNLDYASSGHTGFEPTVIKGDLTAGSTKITIGGTGTNAVIGPGVSVDVDESNLGLNNFGEKSHTSLTDIGTNTHAQIDTHISDSSIHFSDLSKLILVKLTLH